MLNRRASFEHYFWRTTAQQEIDLIEVDNGLMRAFELKWNPARKAAIPLSFRKAYPEAEIGRISPDNYLQLMLE